MDGDRAGPRSVSIFIGHAWDLVSWIHPDQRGWGTGRWCASWQLPGRRTPSLTVPSLMPDNVRISPNGSIITIVGARPSNHGAYRCVASNAYGVAQSVVNLSVHGEGLRPRRLCLPVSSPNSHLCPSPLSWAFSFSEPRSLRGFSGGTSAHWQLPTRGL